MSVHASSCRLCGSSSLHTALHIARAPRNVQRLYRPADLHRDRPVELSVLGCDRCGFVQIEPLLEEEYYDDYLMTATHSRQMQDYQARQARDFVERFQLVGRGVIEIGCGDGSYMRHLHLAGAEVFGIEPSSRSRCIAQGRGYAVEEGYVTAERRLRAGPFEAFVTRQVLEHVPAVHDFLTGIRSNLKPGAAGLVEVPSLEKALQDRRYYDFFPDHVNYFSLRTLRLAMELNGFEVLDAYQDMFDEYNVALVRRIEAPSLQGVAATVDSLGRELREFLDSRRSRGQRVAVWGAGGKGLCVLAAAGISDIDLLVDSDPNKQGLLTPVSHLEVRAPEALADAAYSAVVITAMAYRHEIERTLVEELGFRGAIAVLDHHLEVVREAQQSR